MAISYFRSPLAQLSCVLATELAFFLLLAGVCAGRDPHDYPPEHSCRPLLDLLVAKLSPMTSEYADGQESDTYCYDDVLEMHFNDPEPKDFFLPRWDERGSRESLDPSIGGTLPYFLLAMPQAFKSHRWNSTWRGRIRVRTAWHHPRLDENSPSLNPHTLGSYGSWFASNHGLPQGPAQSPAPNYQSDGHTRTHGYNEDYPGPGKFWLQNSNSSLDRKHVMFGDHFLRTVPCEGGAIAYTMIPEQPGRLLELAINVYYERFDAKEAPPGENVRYEDTPEEIARLKGEADEWMKMQIAKLLGLLEAPTPPGYWQWRFTHMKLEEQSKAALDQAQVKLKISAFVVDQLRRQHVALVRELEEQQRVQDCQKRYFAAVKRGDDPAFLKISEEDVVKACLGLEGMRKLSVQAGQLHTQIENKEHELSTLVDQTLETAFSPVAASLKQESTKVASRPGETERIARAMKRTEKWKAGAEIELLEAAGLYSKEAEELHRLESESGDWPQSLKNILTARLLLSTAANDEKMLRQGLIAPASPTDDLPVTALIANSRAHALDLLSAIVSKDPGSLGFEELEIREQASRLLTQLEERCLEMVSKKLEQEKTLTIEGLKTYFKKRGINPDDVKTRPGCVAEVDWASYRGAIWENGPLTSIGGLAFARGNANEASAELEALARHQVALMALRRLVHRGYCLEEIARMPAAQIAVKLGKNPDGNQQASQAITGIAEDVAGTFNELPDLGALAARDGRKFFREFDRNYYAHENMDENWLEWCADLCNVKNLIGLGVGGAVLGRGLAGTLNAAADTDFFLESMTAHDILAKWIGESALGQMVAKNVPGMGYLSAAILEDEGMMAHLSGAQLYARTGSRIGAEFFFFSGGDYVLTQNDYHKTAAGFRMLSLLGGASMIRNMIKYSSMNPAEIVATGAKLKAALEAEQTVLKAEEQVLTAAQAPSGADRAPPDADKIAILQARFRGQIENAYTYLSPEGNVIKRWEGGQSGLPGGYDSPASLFVDVNNALKNALENPGDAADAATVAGELIKSGEEIVSSNRKAIEEVTRSLSEHGPEGAPTASPPPRESPPSQSGPRADEPDSEIFGNTPPSPPPDSSPSAGSSEGAATVSNPLRSSAETHRGPMPLERFRKVEVAPVREPPPDPETAMKGPGATPLYMDGDEFSLVMKGPVGLKILEGDALRREGRINDALKKYNEARRGACDQSAVDSSTGSGDAQIAKKQTALLDARIKNAEARAKVEGYRRWRQRESRAPSGRKAFQPGEAQQIVDALERLDTATYEVTPFKTGLTEQNYTFIAHIRNTRTNEYFYLKTNSKGYFNPVEECACLEMMRLITQKAGDKIKLSVPEAAVVKLGANNIFGVGKEMPAILIRAVSGGAIGDLKPTRTEAFASELAWIRVGRAFLGDSDAHFGNALWGADGWGHAIDIAGRLDAQLLNLGAPPEIGQFGYDSSRHKFPSTARYLECEYSLLYLGKFAKSKTYESARAMDQLLPPSELRAAAKAIHELCGEETAVLGVLKKYWPNKSGETDFHDAYSRLAILKDRGANIQKVTEKCFRDKLSPLFYGKSPVGMPEEPSDGVYLPATAPPPAPSGGPHHSGAMNGTENLDFERVFRGFFRTSISLRLAA